MQPSLHDRTADMPSAVPATDLQPAEKAGAEHKDSETIAAAEKDIRRLWIAWVIIALIAVAILPFAARSSSIARAIASFCGFTI